MAEFYTWPEAARLSITLLLAFSILSQTLAMVLSFHRHFRGPVGFLENWLELAVLFQVFACTLLHGQIMRSYDLGLVPPTGYGLLRVACFAAILLLAAAVLVTTRKPWPLLIVAAAALTLPVMDAAFPRAFAYFYLAAVLFWLARGICVGALRYRQIRRGLSALSTKHAIDSLHTGVLFCEPNGFVLLANVRMQRLMQAITGKIHRNGKVFYELLAAGDMEPGCRKAELEGQMVCLLPDETAWMFTRTPLRIRRKHYIQLTATDITRRWALTAELQEQEAQLKAKREELNRTIENLHILSEERESQKAKMRAHDVLGQRLTLLLHAIDSKRALDDDLLRSLSQSLLDDLKAEQNVPYPEEVFNGLRQAFGSIGVDIALEGKLPEDHSKARLFTDVIRESVTNAVRHGLATKIWIDIGFSDGAYHLQVTDNGPPPSRPIVEGGGIGGMRKMLEPYGGAVAVASQPRFVLQVDLPGR